MSGQGNDSLPPGNLAGHYKAGVLFVTYSLLIQKGKAGGQVLGSFGVNGVGIESDEDGDEAGLRAASAGALLEGQSVRRRKGYIG